MTAGVVEELRADIRSDIEKNALPELQARYPGVKLGRFNDEEEIFFAEIKERRARGLKPALWSLLR